MSLPPDTISSLPPSDSFKHDTTTEYAVLRIRPRKRGWVAISRALIDDPRLQFDTRAVATWFRSKPDGWHIRLVSLPFLLQQRAGPGERMGRDRVRRILRELEQAGYLVRARSKTRDGRWTWHIDFDDEPLAPTGGHLTIDGSAVDGSPVDGSAVDGSGVHLHKTLNQTRLDQLINKTTTTTVGAAASNTTAGSSGSEYQYPEILQGTAFPSARRMLETCTPDKRQSVLDEIGAMHAVGKVRRPLGLLKALIREAARGQFFPNHSASNAPSPTTKPRRGGEVSDPLPSAQSSSRVPKPVSDLGRETLARWRKRMETEGN
jgi:hypothetical protein